MSLLRSLLALLLVLVPLSAQAQPVFPKLSGRVVDEAHLLSPAQVAQLNQLSEDVQKASTRQFVVATIPDLQGYDIQDYGYQLGRAWGIGQKDANNGILLIVAPNERKVRIEVGYGLEPILTDALSTQIIQTRILPSFRTGAFEVGITAGVDAIDEQLRLDPAEAQARAAAVPVAKPEAPIFPGIVVALVFLFLFLGLIGGAAGRGRRGRGDMAGVLLWVASEALRNSGRGGGGGWGGGRGGGGGFGGGGGGFGGGGASGGW